MCSVVFLINQKTKKFILLSAEKYKIQGVEWVCPLVKNL